MPSKNERGRDSRSGNSDAATASYPAWTGAIDPSPRSQRSLGLGRLPRPVLVLAWSAAVIITVLASLFFALVAFMTQPQDFSAPGPDWVEPGRGVWAWVELATGVLLTSLALSLLPVRVGRMAFPDHQRAITAFGLATPAIAVGMVWIYVAVQ